MRWGGGWDTLLFGLFLLVVPDSRLGQANLLGCGRLVLVGEGSETGVVVIVQLRLI